MKKLLPTLVAGGIAAVLAALPFLPQPRPLAAVPCSLPFTLTNGTTADATQVMANYNAIIACLNNAALAGINNDINSLTGLTTPLPPASGGANTYTATGTSTGTNAIVVASVLPANYTPTFGKRVVFQAANTNTGPVTLNVAGTGAFNLFRMTPSGAVAMAGGELFSGQMAEATFDGSQYQLTSTPSSGGPTGAVIDYASFPCPNGYLPANNGVNPSTASYPLLASLLGTAWGAPGGGTFAVPDLRARVIYGIDSPTTGRISAAGGNFDTTTLGTVGGVQNRFINQANLAAFALPVSDPGHGHQFNFLNSISNGGASYISLATSTSAAMLATSANATTAVTSPFPITNNTTGVTVSTGGSATPFGMALPGAVMTKCIKF